MKHYFTLGQDHTHRINGTTIDCDCVVVIEAPTHKQARDWFFAQTQGRFYTSYEEQDWTENYLKYFPNGYITLEAFY